MYKIHTSIFNSHFLLHSGLQASVRTYPNRHRAKAAIQQIGPEKNSPEKFECRGKYSYHELRFHDSVFTK